MSENIFKKIVGGIEKYSPINYSIVLVLPVIFLIFGFLICNIYLYVFGFSESEILKAKFILSGLIFSLLTLGVLSILELIVSLINFFLKYVGHFLDFISSHSYSVSEFRKNVQKFIFFLRHNIHIKVLLIGNLFCFILLWIFFYTLSIFPIIPSVLGGGQPSQNILAPLG